jgi:hypothetical protein
MRKPFFFVATMAVFAAMPAQAVTVSAGANSLSGTTLALNPQLAGTVVEDEVDAFTYALGDGIFSGSVQSRVTLSIDGTYDFDWRIFDTSFTGTDGSQLGAFNLSAFGGNTIGLDADYRTDGLGAVGPDSARVGDPLLQAIFGGSLSFVFSDGLAAGSDSKFFFLDTEATNYAKTATLSLSNLGRPIVSGPMITTFAPAAAVPEPASWILMLGGMGLVGGLMRRRTGRVAFG